MAAIKTVPVLLLLLLVALTRGADPPAAPAAAPVKPKVCDVCNCKEEGVIDCSGRDLKDNLPDHDWPTTAQKLVSFRNNKIELVKQFPNATIETLVLSNNSIQKIERDAFEYVVNLTVLDLSHNQLDHDNFTGAGLEGPFQSTSYKPLANLKVLDLSWNQFHTLRQNAFLHVTDLSTLRLSHNPFMVFDHSASAAIGVFSNIQEIDLSGCGLSRLDQETFNMIRKKLKKLDLSWNEFKELPHALTLTENLETLILDGNPIEVLDANHSFPIMNKLKELQMNNMTKLREIKEESMGNLGGLETLSIQNCSLLTNIEGYALSIEPKIGGRTWPVVKRLFLSNNALRHLPIELLAQWDKVEEVHMMNNQWSCDCVNQPFINFLADQGTALMGNETQNLLCSSPPEFLNQSFIKHKSHGCEKAVPRGIARENDAAVLVGALIGVLLAVPVTLTMFVLWTQGYFHCGRQSPSSFSRAFYKRTPRYDDDL